MSETPRPPAAPRPPSLLRNPISLAGGAVAVISTAVGLPLMAADLFSHRTNPYLGILIYLTLPMVAMAGVGVLVLGAFWERARRRRRPDAPAHRWPRVDLNNPRHQVGVVGALSALIVMGVLLSITGYRAYHFTESVQFCGLVCHQVMKPEYTAYQHSPHARVACTQCHVGPGASWYVRSKLSGLYQVYAVTTGRYPRPIPSPVKNLRPAQETCEQCHWPAKFFGAQQKTFTHYLADEQNSPWQIQMLLKIGGGDPAVGAPTGIHWHMNIKNDIYYVASDEQRETIPWVRVADRDGHVREYMSTEQPLSPEQLAKATMRRMDCLDCHNRPSHVFRPPDRAVEEAFEAGRLDRSLPYLKREAIRLLSQEYVSDAEASAALLKGLAEFYQREYPERVREQGVAIQQATAELQRIYARNFFPEMRTDWRVHPNHVGHLNAQGCFRCHDGLHKSRDGTVLTKDCAACHTILAQGPPEEVAQARLEAQPFRHPVDVGVDVTEFKCSECHTGTSGL
ncbi:MAG: NapC/NirT family cytochrome c [Candidatus Omnitrophica bacterium]|nr:NapC/NirT family cytochrome c [Candidatus Omnitrophota bacterium]